MKTILVLAQHPEMVESVKAALEAEKFRVVSRAGLEEAEPLLVHGLAEACVLDLETTDVQGAWVVEKLRRLAPKCPLIIYTGAKQWDWEEEAYLRGAAHVLHKPVRPKMLAA